jgi:hypothetical protein
VTTFEEIIRATYEDMYLDTKMIREKLKVGRMQSIEPQQQEKQ